MPLGQHGFDPRRGRNRVGRIDENAGDTEHLVENRGVRSDDWKAAILGLEQRQTQALVMGRADEDVCVLKQLLDACVWLIAVQRHAGKGLE